MKKFLLLSAVVLSGLASFAQNPGKPWKPANADTSYPRTIIHSSELASVRNSLSLGVNLDVYTNLYNSALSSPPAGNSDTGEKRVRSEIAKNAAFVYLLGVKPAGITTTNLSPAEGLALKNKAINLLTQINPFVNQFRVDSPTNFLLWQYSTRELIKYTEAYDFLRGAGVDTTTLQAAKAALKLFCSKLYHETGQTIASTSFFQTNKNSHALMPAAAMGLCAIVLNDVSDTLDDFMPTNWISCAMWNIHNILFWDIRRQADIKTNAGYGEGPHFFRQAFCNILPFMKAMGNFLPDTQLFYKFNQIDRRLRNPWYDTNYTKIFDWYADIRFPDGRMAPIEDTYTYKFMPELAILRKQKYVWPCHFSKLDSLQENTFDKQITSVYDMRADYVAAQLLPQERTDSSLVAYPEAGVAVFRSGSDSASTYFALLGKHGNNLIVTDQYNQADDATFMMVVNGQMMAMDPGLFTDLPILRDSLSVAAAHNTILVDNKATSVGIPQDANGADCYIEKYFKSPMQNYCEVRTNYQGANINRKVMHVHNNYFLVVDHMDSDIPHQYNMLLHGYGRPFPFGDTTIFGLFTDLTASKRGAWKRKGAGLYAYTNSDLPFSMSNSLSRHEHTMFLMQSHTMLSSLSQPTSNMSYMTMLQGYRNLATDTIPTTTFTLGPPPAALGYKVNNGGFMDIAITKSFNNTLAINNATTGLANNYTTDGQFFFASEQSGALKDLFVYNGTHLLRETDTLWVAEPGMNVQFLPNGPKSFRGFVGGKGTVRFFTGEYPWFVSGTGVWNVSYDSITKVTSLYFGKSSEFTISVDDAKTGLQKEARKISLKLYPNPANQSTTIELGDFIAGHASAEVFDLAGKLVYRLPLTGSTKTIDLPVAQLENGMYLVTVRSVEGVASETLKLIVSK